MKSQTWAQTRAQAAAQTGAAALRKVMRHSSPALTMLRKSVQHRARTAR